MNAIFRHYWCRTDLDYFCQTDSYLMQRLEQFESFCKSQVIQLHICKECLHFLKVWHIMRSDCMQSVKCVKPISPLDLRKNTWSTIPAWAEVQSSTTSSCYCLQVPGYFKARITITHLVCCRQGKTVSFLYLKIYLKEFI